MSKLTEIQAELKAPKGQYNSFGKYNYRSCEDILEAVKPLLKGSLLTLSDEIVEIGGRVYVKATASFSSEGEKPVSVTSFAREPMSKKGMDDSQVTGTASSYARKYALNGLFLIDDNKDPDTGLHQQQQSREPSAEAKQIIDLCDAGNADGVKAAWPKLMNAQAVWNELNQAYKAKVTAAMES